MSAARGSNRQDQPGSSGAGVWVLVTVIIGALAVVWAAVQLGHRFAGLGAAPLDPWVVFFGVLDGTVRWPRESTYVLGAVFATLAAIAAGGGWRWTRTGRRRSRVDWTARYLGRGREVEGIAAKSVRATATRLGVDPAHPGVTIGRSVATRGVLSGSWEDTHLDIWGPRTGKTTSRAIPALLDAPGAGLVTSNKRDIVDATRDVRAVAGEVWVFDPQGIAGEEANDWWWNPLSYVVDDVTAETLADLFASSSRALDAKSDAYFEPEGKDLLTGLLLAASLDQRPVTDVYRWTTRPTEDAPVEILRSHGYDLIADGLADVIDAPDKQRAGVYGTAKQMARCLRSRNVEAWITEAGGRGGRRHFDPEEFVRSGGTLYSLSKEGRGSAGGLVAALTVAVIEAAEAYAVDQGGRLRVPLLAVLDEAANVCRWRDLPDLYSHFGSRGIVLMTILQSYSQGVEVWGDHGMKKLWSSANIAVYGGGVREEGFLDMLSKLIGRYDKLTRSTSSRAGAGGTFGSGVTTSRQLQRDLILEVDDLAGLPKGRAVVLSSGNRATLVETMPWMTGPHAAAIRDSIKAHDPEAVKTLREADDELVRVRSDLATHSVTQEVSR